MCLFLPINCEIIKIVVIIINNLLLTECKDHTGEYWHVVVLFTTKFSSFLFDF